MKTKHKVLELTTDQVKAMSEEEFAEITESGFVKICSEEVKIKLSNFIPLSGYELKKSDIIGGL